MNDEKKQRNSTVWAGDASPLPISGCAGTVGNWHPGCVIIHFRPKFTEKFPIQRPYLGNI